MRKVKLNNISEKWSWKTCLTGTLRDKTDQGLPKSLAFSEVHLGRLGRGGSPILVQAWGRRPVLVLAWGCRPVSARWWWRELTLDTNQKADQTNSYCCFFLQDFPTCNQLPRAFSESLHPCTPVLKSIGAKRVSWISEKPGLWTIWNLLPISVFLSGSFDPEKSSE